MKKFLLLTAVACSAALAQWQNPPASGYSTLNAFLSSLSAANTGVGAPTGNCTVGKDFYTDTTVSPGTLYYCPATNGWAKVPLQITGAPGTWPSTWAWSALSGVPSTFNAGQILGTTIPTLAAGHLQYNGTTLVWDSTTYQTAITGAPGTWPTFATVATSGSYADLSNKPTLNSLGGFANPMTTAGDLIVGGTSGAPTRLATPGNGTFCPSWSSGVVTFTSCPGGGSLTLQQDATGLGAVGTINIQTGTLMSNTVTVTSGVAAVQENVNAGGVLNLSTCTSASGSGTTYTCNTNPSLAAYTNHMVINWTPDVNCGSSPTLNINSLGATAVVKNDGSTGSACLANVQEQVWYTGSKFQELGVTSTSTGLPTPANYSLVDDFPWVSTAAGGGFMSNLFWDVYLANSATFTNNFNAFSNHPGVANLSTGTTASSQGIMSQTVGGSIAQFSSLGTSSPFTSWSNTFIVNACAESACTTTTAPVARMQVSLGPEQASGCGAVSTSCGGFQVMADTTAETCTTGTWNTSDWMYVTSTGSATNCVDSGVAFLYGHWHNFVIKSTTPGTIVFCADGTCAAGTTTDVYNGNVLSVLNLANGTTTTNSILAVDYFSFVGQGLSR